MEFFRAYRESELLARVFAGEGEERMLLDLPPEELRPRLRPEGPPPEGVSEESWRRWQRLKPFERRQVLRRLERLARDRQASGRDA